MVKIIKWNLTIQIYQINIYIQKTNDLALIQPIKDYYLRISIQSYYMNLLGNGMENRLRKEKGKKNLPK